MSEQPASIGSQNTQLGLPRVLFILYCHNTSHQSWARDNFYSFATTTTQQRDNVIEPQGPEKIRKKYLGLGVSME